jgi:hypothetical protein
MPLMVVKNNQRGPTVFKTDGGQSHMWWPSGDGMGRDELRLPTDLLDDAGFLGALESGAVELTHWPEAFDDEVVQLRESLQAATDRRAAYVAKALAASEAVMERRQDKDIVGLTCVGPGPAGRNSACGTSVLRPAKEKDATAPLCPGHLHLSPQFVPHVIGSKGSESDPLRTEWKRADGPATA